MQNTKSFVICDAPLQFYDPAVGDILIRDVLDAVSRNDTNAMMSALNRNGGIADAHTCFVAIRTFHECVSAGNEVLAAALLNFGVAVDVRTRLGLTALHVEITHGQSTMVRFLLRHGASTSSFDRYGSTALRRAIESRRSCNVRLLLEAGADVTTRDHLDYTLLVATSQWQTGVVLVLAYSAERICDTYTKQRVLEELVLMTLVRARRIVPVLRMLGTVHGSVNDAHIALVAHVSVAGRRLFTRDDLVASKSDRDALFARIVSLAMNMRVSLKWCGARDIVEYIRGNCADTNLVLYSAAAAATAPPPP